MVGGLEEPLQLVKGGVVRGKTGEVSKVLTWADEPPSSPSFWNAWFQSLSLV